MSRAVITTGRELLREESFKDIEPAIQTFSSVGSVGERFAQELRDVCKQLSQLLAWMWYPEEIPDSGIDPEEEKKLKTAFATLLKYQAFHNNVLGSNAIADLFLGNNESQNIKDVYSGEIPNKLTLQGIFNALTKNTVNYAFTQKYLANFYTEVDVNTFDGDVSYDFFGHYNPTSQPKFVVRIGLPPRPELGKITVSDTELIEWAQNTQDYEPPNPYIPISASC